MKKQSYIVIGLSDFGMHVVRSLALSSVELLVIDRDEKKLEEVSDIVLNTVCADAANPDVLSQLGISEFDGAVIDAEKDLERKVLITMQLKDLGVPYIIVKAVNELEGRVLHKVGADRVVQMDCDFSHDPADIARLVAEDADLVIGSRYLGPSRGVLATKPVHSTTSPSL